MISMPIDVSAAEPITLIQSFDDHDSEISFSSTTVHPFARTTEPPAIPTNTLTKPPHASAQPTTGQDMKNTDQQVRNDVLQLRNLALQHSAQRMESRPLKQTKVAALTFDDGPSPYTPQILKILNEYHIRATFFVLGENAKKYPDLIRQIHADGHIIGNHTWNHSNLTRLSSAQIKEELQSTNQLIESLTGAAPHLFRPPYGSVSDSVRQTVQHAGMTSFLWNVDPADWNLKLTKPITARVSSELRDHSVILLHDGGGPRDQTVASLPVIIEQLQKQGYEFVTVPEYLVLYQSL